MENSTEVSPISKRLLESFDVSNIPFLECDFENLYPELAKIIPNETVTFTFENINTLIACETVCSAICHQINWDYLRLVVLEKTKIQPNWLEPERLSNISKNEVESMLAGYNRPERIRADERAAILRQVGSLAKRHGGFGNLFFDDTGELLLAHQIHNIFFECVAFSQDPNEKKFQILLQKLSSYAQLSKLIIYSKPAVDYHLIRCFLRRGLIYPTNKSGVKFLFSTEILRRETTVGALRQLCAILIQRISDYTDLSINIINQIEWHIGRTVCKEGTPDCLLEHTNVDWVRKKYKKCPFYTTCCAVKYNQKLLHIEEPTYLGTSY